MNWLDWAILAVIVLSTLLAAAQGFVFEVISLAGSVLAFLLASWTYPMLAPWFLPYVKAAPFADMAAFLTILFAVVLLSGAIARLARWAMKEVGLRWFDRLLGGVFGLARGVLVVVAALMAMAAFAPAAKALTGSQSAGFFLVAARGAVWLAPSDVRQKFREGMDALRRAAPSGADQQTKPSPVETH